MSGGDRSNTFEFLDFRLNEVGNKKWQYQRQQKQVT